MPDLVLMVWALAVLEQYGCRLYRHATFRAKRLPDGVPSQPRLRRMLREATTLHRWGWATHMGHGMLVCSSLPVQAWRLRGRHRPSFECLARIAR